MNYTRGVVNEPELLEILQQNVKSEFALYFAPPLDAWNGQPSIEILHSTWKQYAIVFSRAAVVIGPHGGALNNMIWTPDDTHVIEFNQFPDDDSPSQSHGGTPVRHVFLNAFWAKGSGVSRNESAQAGKFWIISPTLQHPMNFYIGKMRISPFELVAVLQRIGGLLVDGYSNPFSPEKHHIRRCDKWWKCLSVMDTKKKGRQGLERRERRSDLVLANQPLTM